MRQKRYKWDDYPIGECLDDINNGLVDVPYLNREFKWGYSKIIEYLEVLFEAGLSGTLVFWETDPKKGKIPSCQINATGSNSKVRKLALDGGHRTRTLWSIRFNKSIPGADGLFGSQGVKVSFNPLTTEFRKATKKNMKERGWMHDFAKIWSIKDPSEIFDHTKNLAAEFIENNYADGMFETLDDDQKELIRKNIEYLVEIIFLDFHYAFLPKYITLGEALKAFRGINSSGVKVNTVDSLLSMIFGNDEGIGHRIRNFAIRNEEREAGDKCNVLLTSEDVLVAALGIHGKDIHKTAKLIDIYDSCGREEFRDLVDKVIDEHTFTEFESNVVKHAGYTGKTTGSMVFPGVYTLYLDAIHNHGFDANDIFGIFRQLFFVVGILPKRFTGNLTDNLARLLKKLKSCKTLEEYKVKLIEQIVKFKQANINGLSEILLEDTYKNSKYLHVLKAVAIINNAKLLFSNNYVRNNIDVLHVHHLHATNFNFYDDSVKENKELLDSLMNTCFVSRGTNLQISNNPIQVYFSKAICEHKGDVDKQLELSCLDKSWGEGVNDIDELSARLENRSLCYADLIEKTIDRLDKQ